MKKIIFLTTLICLMVLSVPINAYEFSNNEFLINEVDSFVSKKSISFDEIKNIQPITEIEKRKIIEGIVNKAINERRANPLSIEQQMQILKIDALGFSVDELNQIENSISTDEIKLNIIDNTLVTGYTELVIPQTNLSISATSTYDENKAKLRTGNFIEGILNSDEGISELQQATAIANSASAKSAAKNVYPENSNYEDAYRHYYWNFLMTNNIGKLNARTCANNHEWGLVILTPVLNYYDSQFNYYINSGYSNDSAANKALADTIMDIPVTKYYTYLVCDSNYSSFIGFFNNDNIMDLNNNCYGRAASIDNCWTEWVSDLSSNYIITSSSNVTSANKYAVWANDWYGY